jgi:hypothetical protein
MSDTDTLPPETDDEIRARMRRLAKEVTERTDTEAALERMPRRERPSTPRLLAVAACLLAVVALAVALAADREEVDTIGPSESPTQTTECPSTTLPRAITQGAPMNKRFAAPVASAATAILLVAACSDDDDGPRTLAKGDVEFVGSVNLGGMSMEIDAEEEDGEVTGEARFSNEVVVTFECADTDTDGVVILAGEVTTASFDGSPAVGELMAVIIREGEPDSGLAWVNDPPPNNAGSCDELLETIRDDVLTDDDAFADVADGDDIETG